MKIEPEIGKTFFKTQVSLVFAMLIIASNFSHPSLQNNKTPKKEDPKYAEIIV